MYPFDYIVLFFAIPVGLALAEMAQGLALALRRRQKFAIGMLTPLLVLFLLILTSLLIESFWDFRERLNVDAPVIFAGFVFTYAFYVAASFVFPEDFEEGVSLDDWFMAKRAYSLGWTSILVLGFFFTYVGMTAGEKVKYPVIAGLVVATFFAIIFFPIIAALRAKTVRGATIAMVVLNVVYILGAAALVMSR
ncbi:hypothetical protein VCJ71_02780 [Alteriqipengyuania sp. WL0013]|uniref:hypothetical protein n=1 Tax=Alteriqipengyuania sp. WL0013 TaxID=3110773 RepID=UPI002C2CBB08|nr:hypothetical protein [Alteriqipengyuania sp. WL0013]MEB3414986.1 hypothetical protein [Alteriqipengyuania sp. WL0013]